MHCPFPNFKVIRSLFFISDGLIEFGKEGDILPILSYQDMNPITVRYFSFAAWSGVEAKFLYDCPIPSANGTKGK